MLAAFKTYRLVSVPSVGELYKKWLSENAETKEIRK